MAGEMSAGAPNGFLNLRKPRGITSHDAVDAVRRILSANAGHGGTLDPGAEGVLPIAVGTARRFLPYLRHDKEYEGVMRLGVESDTWDADGRTGEPVEVTATPAEIRAAGEALVGELELPVPPYSAVKVGGRRLYELARSGAAVSPPVRPMRVFALETIAVEPPRVRFRVSCAGGTYVRSLVRAWGVVLGCGAILERLTRTRAGAFLLANATDLESLRRLAAEGRAGEVLVGAGQALAHLPEARLDAGAARAVLAGRVVDAPQPLPAGRPVRLVGPDGRLLGLASYDAAAERLSPVRMVPPDTA
jgi:tRNA pseudouridine55 synthase